MCHVIRHDYYNDVDDVVVDDDDDDDDNSVHARQSVVSLQILERRVFV
jgi:hypothetical protein